MSDPVAPTPADGDRRAPRSYAAVLVALGAGAALIFLGYGRTWSTSVVTDVGLPTITVELSGREVAPAGAAMALVALTGIAALVATRRVGRLITSVVLILAGVLAAYVAVASGASSSASGAGQISDRTGLEVVTSGSTTGTAWWAVAAVGGLVVAASGAVALRTSAAWPVLGGRYERSATGSPGASTHPVDLAARPPVTRPAPATASVWDQLDAGVDPTVRHGSEAEHED